VATARAGRYRGHMGRAFTLLDGAMGTELEARGADTSGTAWSARAISEAPALVRAIHAEYAQAGAAVHTANTFRTTPRAYGQGWQRAMHEAVALCREAVGPAARIAGSVAPLEDCWHPERSPPDGRPEHRQIAQELARAGVDLILCETFANVGEALIAVECARETGLPVWVSFTSGPWDDLCSPEQMRAGALAAIGRGVQAVLINCTPAPRVLPYLRACVGLGAPVGVQANAELGPGPYAEHARRWLQEGATLVGGCCGTSPAHIRALANLG
jgi:S-methylmethionine-dependent homocysteine/selenocysteine methylase